MRAFGRCTAGAGFLALAIAGLTGCGEQPAKSVQFYHDNPKEILAIKARCTESKGEGQDCKNAQEAYGQLAAEYRQNMRAAIEKARTEGARRAVEKVTRKLEAE